jgi:possible [acyl-carrier-protein] phosphodiesterase
LALSTLNAEYKMNFLAHSYLSFSEEQLVGNMIADFVKNRDVARLPESIQKGIKLHRAIDTFTDAHPLIHEAKAPFRPLVRLYSGAFVDVAFDYFLANDTTENSQREWQEHSQRVYAVLRRYEEFLPEVFKKVLDKMQQDDWLYNYRNEWGIEYSFRNVVNKAQFLDKTTNVFPAFLANKDFLREKYEIFFPEIKSFAQDFVD